MTKASNEDDNDDGLKLFVSLPLVTIHDDVFYAVSPQCDGKLLLDCRGSAARFSGSHLLLLAKSAFLSILIKTKLG